MQKKGHKKIIEKQTLWIFTELYYPEETSTGYYLTRIAEGLADEFRVKVICGQPNYSAKGTIAPKEEVHKGVKIYRVWATRLNKNIILFRVINMLTLGLSTFFKGFLKLKKGEKVLVVTTPPSLPFVTAIASLLKGASYTLLIHDNYPEILIAVGKAKENSIFVKFLDLLNNWLYKYSAKIIVVGRDMYELISKKIDGLEIPVETIPNWAELEQVEPRNKANNQLLKENNLSDKFIFLYAGNMGHPNDLESLVWCAEKIRKKKEIHFIFLGAGVKKNWLKKTVRDKKLENITILDPQPRSKQNIFLNACDVGLVSLVKKMWGVSMPSRTYNILAAGKPILAITEKDSELAKVLEEDSVGWFVAPGEKQILLNKILEIFEKQNCLGEFGKRARSAALNKYSLEKALERYSEALKNNASDNELV